MVHEIEILRDYLRQNQLRLTPQRQTILEVFLNTGGHVEIDELFPFVQREDPSIGIATLYRTMNLLVECGLARENTAAQGRKNYEQAYRQRHHDHLICTACGKIVEFEHPLIEKYQMEVCREYNFTLNQHRMEIYGTCTPCQNSKG